MLLCARLLFSQHTDDLPLSLLRFIDQDHGHRKPPLTAKWGVWIFKFAVVF